MPRVQSYDKLELSVAKLYDGRQDASLFSLPRKGSFVICREVGTEGGYVR